MKLTFDGIPERLVVPFNAIKVFFDPSVRYGLQFEAPDFGPDATSHPLTGQDDVAPSSEEGAPGRNAPTPIRATTTRSASERKPRATRKPRVEKTLADATGSGAAESADAGSTTAVPRPSEKKPAERVPAAKP